MLSFLLAATVTVTWQAPSTTIPITGYKVYIGAASGNYTSSVDAGNVTTKQVTVDLTTPKYFVVRAYNPFGESGNSNEVGAGIPTPPSGLVVAP